MQLPVCSEEATNRSWLQVQKLRPPLPTSSSAQHSLVWLLLYKLGIAQDWQRTKLTLQALALLLVKPQRSASRKAFRDPTDVPLLNSLWVSGSSFRGKYGRTQREQGFASSSSNQLLCSPSLSGRGSVSGNQGAKQPW